MQFLQIAALSVWAVAAVCGATSVPVIARGVNYNQLATKLSGSAQIYLPGSALFTEYTARWSNVSIPVANAVVVPATEQDVVQIVNISCSQKLDHHAHSFTRSLSPTRTLFLSLSPMVFMVLSPLLVP